MYPKKEGKICVAIFQKKIKSFETLTQKQKKKKKKPMFVVSLMCLYQSDVNPTQFVTLVSWGI